MATNSVEARLSALEAEVADLKREVRGQKDKDAWKSNIGRFANDPMYDEAMALGRKYRESLRPGKSKKPKKRHGDS